MNRREFIKGAILTAAFFSSGQALAYNGEEEKSGGLAEQGLLRLQNREDPSVAEQKHVPAIEAPAQARKGRWFDVKVKVGFMREHPSNPDHWITFIKLLANGQEIAKTEFPVGGVSASCATFRIRLEETSKIEAIENCNLHGTWISDPVTLTV